MTTDRHAMRAVRVQAGLKPDLLILESTYATTIRDSKRARERCFFKKAHEGVMDNRKVRSFECEGAFRPHLGLRVWPSARILLESYWDRMELNVSICLSQGLAEKANQHYRLFNQREHQADDALGPMIRLLHVRLPSSRSIAGMLHGGQSLRRYGDAKNMIIMPGFYLAGTLSVKIINGMKRIDFDGMPVSEISVPSVQHRVNLQV